jgi:hypothetical protein
VLLHDCCGKANAEEGNSRREAELRMHCTAPLVIQHVETLTTEGYHDIATLDSGPVAVMVHAVTDPLCGTLRPRTPSPRRRPVECYALHRCIGAQCIVPSERVACCMAARCIGTGCSFASATRRPPAARLQCDALYGGMHMHAARLGEERALQ